MLLRTPGAPARRCCFSRFCCPCCWLTAWGLDRLTLVEVSMMGRVRQCSKILQSLQPRVLRQQREGLRGARTERILQAGGI